MNWNLTPREEEVLDLLRQGASTVVIASTLFVTKATVRNHIQSILFKLGAHSRLEAVAISAQGHSPLALAIRRAGFPSRARVARPESTDFA